MDPWKYGEKQDSILNTALRVNDGFHLGEFMKNNALDGMFLLGDNGVKPPRKLSEFRKNKIKSSGPLNI